MGTEEQDKAARDAAAAEQKALREAQDASGQVRGLSAEDVADYEAKQGQSQTQPQTAPAKKDPTQK